MDKIVRLNLNLDDSEPIYSDKLDTLLYLNYVSPASSSIDSVIAEDLNWESISSIEEIDKIKNLVAISLPDSSIKDLSPLKNLSSLMALNLSGNKLVDISDLKDITSLQILILNNNKLNDSIIQPLKSMSQLYYLDLRNNNDISDYKSITDLDIDNLFIKSK
ncbi:MAG: hypothetical protein N4A40_09980 [Tissierellales bacterium]|nr:hypothetical protein [Tissierellales bacterium]